jgi:intein-encoded DNA endonuclease-like protein
MGSRNSVLTEQEKKDVVRLYSEGLGTTKIAKKYMVWPNAISGLLKRRGIQLRGMSESHRKYKIQENFFDTIDTEEKAYILGLFYADGSNNTRRYKAYIMLAEIDKDILVKIQKIISPNKPLHYQKRRGGNASHQNRYMFYINNKHMSIQLEQLGCMTNKTYKLTFPWWLDKTLYNHFIRGYFDGDGHVGIYGKNVNFSIVGTKSFCSSLQEIFKKELGTNTVQYCRHPERKNNIRDIRTSGTRQVEQLLDWLYKDATIFINRKYNKYQELKEKAKGIDETIKKNKAKRGEKVEGYMGRIAKSRIHK